MRIEDLDGPRVKPGAGDACLGTLAWLGIDWDAGPLVQSSDLEPYRAAMDRLAARALVFPSELTRQELEEAAGDAALSAPQEGASESRCPAELRPALVARAFDRWDVNWRFATPAGIVEFHDAFMGPQRIDPSRTIGDFVVWTKRGQPAYQLAVVVDDHRQGITHVVRGNDLLESAARQLRLYRALEIGPEPTHLHLPLVRGADGRRLAKRHGDTRIDRYRHAGVRRERVIGLLAHWCGITGPRREMDAGEFAAALELDTIARTDITFTTEDDAWLLGSR
jgi:glutamyl-tRNA synthetase